MRTKLFSLHRVFKNSLNSRTKSNNDVHVQFSCSVYYLFVPEAPMCLNVTSLGPTALQVYWLVNYTGGAEFFHISHNGSANYTIVSREYACSLNSTLCNQNITDLQPGKTYGIQIFASTQGDQNSQSCSLLGTTMPIAPDCIEVRTLNTSVLKVIWRKNVTDGATEFKIIVSSGNETVSRTVLCGASSSFHVCEYNITGLKPGAAYDIVMFASTNGILNDKFCSLQGTTMPSEPIEFKMLERTPHNFTIKWEDGSGYRDFYRIYYNCLSPNEPSESWQNYKDLNQTVKNYTSIYLEPGTQCELKVYAAVIKRENIGSSQNELIFSLSLNGSVSTNETAPESVSNFNVSEVTSTYVRINWLPPSRRNGIIRRYILTVIANEGYCVEKQECVKQTDFSNDSRNQEDYICQDIEQLTETLSCSTDISPISRSFLVDNLKPYVTYSIGIKAYTSCSGHSIVWNTTTSSTDPRRPRQVNATAIGPNEIMVKWTSPVLCTGVTTYSVSYTDIVDNRTFTISCSNSSKGFRLNECTLYGLEEYWWYKIQVVATVDSFPSNISSSISQNTKEATPGPIEDLELKPVTNVTESRGIIVKWRPPSTREKNGVILFYKIVCYHDSARLIEIHMMFEPTELQHTVLLENLTAEWMYCINISANTSAGYGVIVQGNATVTSGDDPFRGDSSEYLTKVILKYKSWRDIKDEEIFSPYRATHYTWKPMESCVSQAWKRHSTGMQNGSYTESFIIGQDGDITDTIHHFCNGYLKPDTEYSVRVFVCTSEGCTESVWSPPIKTDKDYAAFIIALSVVPSLLMLGITAFMILKMRKFMRCRVHKTEMPVTFTDENPLEMRGSKIKIHRPIKLSELQNHVDSMHKDSNAGFSSEYKFLNEIEPKHSTAVAESQACRTKNRYTNILPYDHSRVKLLPIEDEEGSDYINANYIQGYNFKREYIATQDPLPATRGDFWRMVWEQNIEMIVMLTKCMEMGRVKYEKYWPEVNEPVYHGDLIVNVTSESILSDYIIRVIELRLTRTTRKVYHFSFLSWPNLGCPMDPGTLLNFITTLRSYVKPGLQCPIVIHCSAGVGRTGTFIAIDHLMQHVRDYNEVDIFSLVYEMRNQRCNMVKTEDEYVYIHESILEFLAENANDTNEEPVCQNTAMAADLINENTTFIQD